MSHCARCVDRFAAVLVAAQRSHLRTRMYTWSLSSTMHVSAVTPATSRTALTLSEARRGLIRGVLPTSASTTHASAATPSWHAGKKVAVTCVPPLSPPEAATAVREQQEVPAAGATDVWAAGVIACQLLAPAATAHASLQPDSAAAWDAACGRAPFPWEPASPLHKACVAELLSAADAVLACVSRTPGDRPTSAQLVGLLGDVLAAQEQAGP